MQILNESVEFDGDSHTPKDPEKVFPKQARKRSSLITSYHSSIWEMSRNEVENLPSRRMMWSIIMQPQSPPSCIALTSISAIRLSGTEAAFEMIVASVSIEFLVFAT